MMPVTEFNIAKYLDRPEIVRAYVREVIMEHGGLFPEDADRIIEALWRAGLEVAIRKEMKEMPTSSD